MTKTLDELRALTVRLEALADPWQEATPSYENTDWRGLANTCAHALRELIADAERYRWFRNNRESVPVGGGLLHDVYDEDGTVLWNEQLDAAVDAARAQRTKASE